MTTPTASIRHDVKAALVSSLREALPGVQVEYGDPGDTTEAESVFFISCEGPAVVPTSKAPPWEYEDDFTLALLIQAARAGESTLEAAEERAMELLAGVTSSLASNPTLDNVDGLGSIGMELQISGPSAHWTSDGPVTFIRVEIDVKSRFKP